MAESDILRSGRTAGTCIEPLGHGGVPVHQLPFLVSEHRRSYRLSMRSPYLRQYNRRSCDISNCSSLSQRMAILISVFYLTITIVAAGVLRFNIRYACPALDKRGDLI